MGAIRSLALALGLIAGAVLSLSIAADEHTLNQGWLSWWPDCSARRAGGACALCGMSHSFVALSHGNLDEARRLNPAGPWLYSAFVFQVVVGVGAAVGTFRKRRCPFKRTG
jgi:hypothetical protein